MPVDLKAYAARIEYTGEFTPALATLRGLHLAHATHITFENLDILLRRPIRLDLESYREAHSCGPGRLLLRAERAVCRGAGDDRIPR